MLSNFGMFFACWYFLYFSDYEVNMKRSGLDKVVYIFKNVGIIAGAIWAVICIIKELASIPWQELAENGVLEHVYEVVETIILYACWLFIMWILHAFAMLMLHKLWPDTYDESGHRKK